MFFYVDLQNFAAGYQVNDKGLRIPLTDVQRADRTDSSKANELLDWNDNQRNHGGAEDIPISEDALQMLRDTFQKLRENGGTGYVRFNYAVNAEVPQRASMILKPCSDISSRFPRLSLNIVT